MHEFYQASPDSTEKHLPTSREVASQIVPEISEPCHNIFSQIRPYIQQGQYGLIMQEGDSSRLPRIIIEQAMGVIYTNLGYEYPGVITEPFYDVERPGAPTVAEKVTAKLNKRKHGKRILVVTEYMNSGRSIERYQKIEQLGFDYDVAALFSRDEKEAYDGAIKNTNNLYIGQVKGRTPLIYKRPEVNGRAEHNAPHTIFRYRKSRKDKKTIPFDYPFGDIKASEVMQEVWSQAQKLRAELVEAYK